MKPNMHIIWLDNLFTIIRFLEELRRANIRAAGTVRPPANQTLREERLETTKRKQEAKKEKEIKRKEKAAKKKTDNKEREAKKEAANREKQIKKEKRSTQQSATILDSIPLSEPLPFYEAASLFKELSKELPGADTDNSIPFLELNELPNTESPDSRPIKQEEEQEIDNRNPKINEPFNDDLIKLRALVN